jgi:hypothetical protein
MPSETSNGFYYLKKMAKLGYTWYPKDWGNSDGVFELNLSERGLYRELIDLAMLNDNKTEVKLDVWIRRFSVSNEDLKSILDNLCRLKLIEIKDDLLFIPSCESRLQLVRGGSNGGKKSKPPMKPDSKPNDKPDSKPTTKQTKKKHKIESESNYFRDSEYFDKNKFKSAFPEWQKDKLAYYYEQVLTWSNEGNKKIDWIATVRTWANRDEKQGKIKFASKQNNQIGGLV